MVYGLIPYTQMPANATQYTMRLAVPESAVLQMMTATWCFCSWIAAVASFVLLFGVLSCETARRSAFNLFLVGLTVPDLVLNVSSGIALTVNLIHPDTAFSSFYFTFGLSASFWLNAVVVHEVFVLLRKTQRLESYWPPSRRVVLFRCVLVYAWASFVASWHMWGVLPIRSQPLHGLSCIALDYDVPSTIFFWLAYMPAAIGIPTMYAITVGYICWRDKLIGLPSPVVRRSSMNTARNPAIVSSAHSRPTSNNASEEGACSSWAAAPPALAHALPTRSLEQRSRQARALSVYFARAFLVFFVMWTPAILLIYITSFRSPWPIWVGGVWAHCEGLVSALIGMSKRDVGNAVADLLSCGGRLRLSPTRVSVAVHGAPSKKTVCTESALSTQDETVHQANANSLEDSNRVSENDVLTMEDDG